MSLQDTDPNTTNRIEPTPQAMDQNPTRVSDGTTAITNKQDGSSGAYVSTKDATVKVNDGTVNRVALGLLPDGSYGLKVSQDGFDVLTAADDDLIFNSAQNSFKIVRTINATIPATGTATTPAGGGFNSQTAIVTVAHNLGYNPAVIAFALYSSTVWLPIPLSRIVSNTTKGWGTANFIMYVDTTNITFHQEIALYDTTAGVTGSLPAMQVKAYILQETAN